MKHKKKEWHTCDRYGENIEHLPYRAGRRHILRRGIFHSSQLKMLTNNKFGYISDTEFILPEIVAAEIIEGYFDGEKTIHLCGKCRNDFEKFMKNEMEVCK